MTILLAPAMLAAVFRSTTLVTRHRLTRMFDRSSSRLLRATTITTTRGPPRFQSTMTIESLASRVSSGDHCFKMAPVLSARNQWVTSLGLRRVFSHGTRLTAAADAKFMSDNFRPEASRFLLLYSCSNLITRRATALTELGKRAIIASLVVLPTTWMTGLISTSSYVLTTFLVPITLAGLTFTVISVGVGFSVTSAYVRSCPQLLYRPITDIYLNRDSLEFLAVSETLLGPELSFSFLPADVTVLSLISLTDHNKRRQESVLRIKGKPILFRHDRLDAFNEEDEKVKEKISHLYEIIKSSDYPKKFDLP